ncbi:zinc finger BED domain-containing protein 1-like [Sitophilus oryzae]|uniref:Zinc finger BED domain-containing protein 1-like n=1 Tax=Sitophilus oryzae TaxID=7048 RepID=A0A6J2YQY0_SITOR|nr:zinc finger BED domain-containing protein 1-like [Sitophilus oryzae]
MSTRGKRSIVWTFFILTQSKKIVQCTLCKKEYKYFKNTTNLKEHLKRMHPSCLLVPASIQEDDEDEDELLTPSGSREMDTPQTPNLSTASSFESTKKPSQLRHTKQLCLAGSSRSNTLSQSQIKNFNLALIKMIVFDYQPLQIVEDRGFREFTKKLNPLYTLPSRKMLTSKLIPELYQTEIHKLKSKLSAVDHVGVTTDLWTSDTINHYITITIHFIENAELHTSALQTSEVQGSQTGSHIASELMEIFNKWEISRKVVTVVSDNGANIKSAINDHLHMHHHPCVAHTLNLTVKDGLIQNNELNVILQKCRNIVGHFKHSAIAVEKLSTMQQQMNSPQLKVKQDVVTRWNSTYIMLDRLIAIKASITAVMSSLPKAPEMLNAEEWLILEDCICVLKPFDLMTTTLSGEKYVTLSSIIPLVRGLQYSLNRMNCLTDIGNKLKVDLLAIISRRLGSYERDKISAKATFLDPRYKKQAFGSQDNANNAEKWIIEELGSLIAETSLEAPTTVSQSEVDHADSDNTLWEYLDKKITDSTNVRNTSPTAKAILMVKQYLSMANTPRSSSPLAFWSANENLFPALFKMHKKYLCAPATSVPSERIFSKSGIITNSRRNRLSAKNLNQIIFLNTNL